MKITFADIKRGFEKNIGDKFISTDFFEMLVRKIGLLYGEQWEELDNYVKTFLSENNIVLEFSETPTLAENKTIYHFYATNRADWFCNLADVLEENKETFLDDEEETLEFSTIALNFYKDNIGNISAIKHLFDKLHIEEIEIDLSQNIDREIYEFIF